jgi:ribosomal protein S18 acetylase RimI-like enzyme
MLQNGIAGPDDENDIDEFFRQQKDLYLHLEQTATEDWVAEDEANGLVGWARSIERDNHLQLTHFFVATTDQGSGVGRALLELAFPLDRGQQRSIIATTNPRALSLYLRFGVSFQGMAFSFYGEPQVRELNSDLEIEQVEASSKTLEKIVALDAEVLGYRRPVDLEFFMNNQPTFLFRRRGRLVAYAFGCDGKSAGPAAALDPEDLPALLNQIEHSACQSGLDSLWLTIPAIAKSAVSWGLTSGYKIDPFHEVLLAKRPSMKLDRFIMTQSAFLW